MVGPEHKPSGVALHERRNHRRTCRVAADHTMRTKPKNVPDSRSRGRPWSWIESADADALIAKAKQYLINFVCSEAG
jgi:hypothetical protein